MTKQDKSVVSNLVKPLLKIKQAGKSANRYRKQFRYLVREKGSIGKAYQTVRREAKKNGIRSAKNLLKQQGKHVVNFQNSLISVQQIFDKQQKEFTKEELVVMQEKFAYQPLISIIMPTYNTPSKWLARAIESLQEQIYSNWELCVVDDCSTNHAPRNLLQRLAQQDSRIRYHFSDKNMGISGASNIALNMAKGEFIALLDHDDEITPDALFWMVKTINDEPETDFIYTDECKIDDTPARHLFHLIPKPDWSPEIMFNGMLTGHFTAYKTELVREVGGFRSEYDFSQDYDLALRMSRVAKKIVHIERVLYLWRAISGSAASDNKSLVRETNIAALQSHLNSLNVPAKVAKAPLLDANRVIVLPFQEDKVSIIIPSDSYENLKKAINGVLECTSYRNYEIIAVCNSPLAKKLEKEYGSCPKLKFSCYDKKYNFSDKCNQGASVATGKFIVFYNDDVFPIQSDWLHLLVEYLYIPNVGGVSPKLMFENNRIQYAGMISGTPGLYGTSYYNYEQYQYDDYLSMHLYVRNISILSGACCAILKTLFDEVGGFDAINTPDGHSDVDLSFKIRKAGYRCVYTPYSELHHIGNHSWGGKTEKYKADIFCLKKWGEYTARDPYFTETMRQVLYRDFTFDYKIYNAIQDSNHSYTGQDVLFVSHELSNTGAPHMLYYAALAVKNSGGFPVVVSPKDGEIRQQLVDAGITVIIDASIHEGHFLFKMFAKNFDKVIVNTDVLPHVVRHLSEIKGLDVIWWLHESKMLSISMNANADLADKDIDIWCVSKYAHSFIPNIFQAKILYNGILDIKNDYIASEVKEHLPMTFSVVGTVEPRKAQDIFCQAIGLLPEEIRKNCRFYLAGKYWDENFIEEIKTTISTFTEIEYLGLITHDEVIKLMKMTDVLVCCSRDESFSLTCAEAAMLGKAIILNKNVGVSEVLVHQESCLMHEVENAQDLANQMIFAYYNRDKVAEIGKNARHVFEQKLSFEKFSQAFLDMLK